MFHYLFILKVTSSENGFNLLDWLNNTGKKYFSNLMTLSQMNLASLTINFSAPSADISTPKILTMKFRTQRTVFVDVRRNNSSEKS